MLNILNYFKKRRIQSEVGRKLAFIHDRDTSHYGRVDMAARFVLFCESVIMHRETIDEGWLRNCIRSEIASPDWFNPMDVHDQGFINITNHLMDSMYESETSYEGYYWLFNTYPELFHAAQSLENYMILPLLALHDSQNMFEKIKPFFEQKMTDELWIILSFLTQTQIDYAQLKQESFILFALALHHGDTLLNKDRVLEYAEQKLGPLVHVVPFSLWPETFLMPQKPDISESVEIFI